MTSRIPSAFINELLRRIDIVDIIETRIHLRKTGTNYSALCPFHTEKTASFTVSPAKQFYYCFGCSAKGNAIGFLMEYHRMEFVDAVETLAKQAGLTIPYEVIDKKQNEHQDLYALLKQITNYYQLELKKNSTAYAYLQQRGLSDDIIQRFKIGFAPASWDALIRQFGKNKTMLHQLIASGMIIKKSSGGYYDRFRERIMFPIHDSRGRVIGFGGRVIGVGTPKYLNSPETPIFHKGNELYGLYEAKQTNKLLTRLILVEGYMDVIGLAQHGITNAVATLGTATSAKHLQRIFRQANEVIFCFDGDDAGQKAAWRALEIALPLMHDGLQAQFMFLPSEQDPDSLIKTQGRTEFENLLQQALPLETFLFQQLSTQFNSKTLGGKTQLAKQAIDLINKIPSGVFQQLLLQKLSSYIGIEAKQLSLPNKKPMVRAAISNEPTAPINNPQIHPPIRLAIALLLQFPQLAQALPDTSFLNTLNLPGIKTLTQIITYLDQQPQLTTAMLLERWRNSHHIATLHELAALNLMIPEQGLAAELLGALHQIQSLEEEDSIQKLLTKAKVETLSQEEKQQLQNLIVKKKKKQP